MPQEPRRIPDVIDYASPRDREPRRRLFPAGIVPAIVALVFGALSLIGFDDRMVDAHGEHAQLYVSPCVYPFLLVCFLTAAIGIARIVMRLVRDRRVSRFEAFLLLLNIVAVLIPLAGMARQYWISLYPLTYRRYGAPGGF